MESIQPSLLNSKACHASEGLHSKSKYLGVDAYIHTSAYDNKRSRWRDVGRRSGLGGGGGGHVGDEGSRVEYEDTS